MGALSGAQILALLGGLLILALLVAQAAQWWFLFRLVHQNGRLLVRLEALESGLGAGGVVPSQNEAQQAEGLPVGAEAPTFDLEGLYGESLTLEALRAPGKPVMLLFTDPGCGPCMALLPEIGRWQREHADKLTTALISRGSAEENRTKSAEHGLTNVLLQDLQGLQDRGRGQEGRQEDRVPGMGHLAIVLCAYSPMSDALNWRVCVLSARFLTATELVQASTQRTKVFFRIAESRINKTNNRTYQDGL